MSSHDDEDDVTLDVGDLVWAYDDDEGYWYPAQVIGKAEDSITVIFDDDDEEGYELDYDSVQALDLQEGDDVECLADDETYYPATIESITDEAITVRYEDDTTAEVDLGQLRTLGAWSTGDYVWAYYDDDYWYPAEITGFDEDGGIVVTYLADELKAALDEDSLNDLYLDIGADIEVWWHDDEAYYPATILNITDDGQVEVEFEDGTATVDIADVRMAA